uniref:Uncharacterized protein n=1 Tax=Glossina palpalis gambiensis TaxID=67801 RepID=A0A1B0B138_9MUSC
MYAGWPESEEHDQGFNAICVRFVTKGRNAFTIHTGPPDITNFAKLQVLGFTTVTLRCLHRNPEFSPGGGGYFLNIQYIDIDWLESSPIKPRFDKLLPRELECCWRRFNAEIALDFMSSSGLDYIIG